MRVSLSCDTYVPFYKYHPENQNIWVWLTLAESLVGILGSQSGAFHTKSSQAIQCMGRCLSFVGWWSLLRDIFLSFWWIQKMNSIQGKMLSGCIPIHFADSPFWANKTWLLCRWILPVADGQPLVVVLCSFPLCSLLMVLIQV